MLKLLKLKRLVRKVNSLMLDRASLPYLVVIENSLHLKEYHDYFIAVLDYAIRKKTISIVQRQAIDRIMKIKEAK